MATRIIETTKAKTRKTSIMTERISKTMGICKEAENYISNLKKGEIITAQYGREGKKNKVNTEKYKVVAIFANKFHLSLEGKIVVININDLVDNTFRVIK